MKPALKRGNMSAKRKVTWVVEITTDKKESTMLYYHVLESLVKEEYLADVISICFLFVLTNVPGLTG